MTLITILEGKIRRMGGIRTEFLGMNEGGDHFFSISFHLFQALRLVTSKSGGDIFVLVI